MSLLNYGCFGYALDARATKVKRPMALVDTVSNYHPERLVRHTTSRWSGRPTQRPACCHGSKKYNGTRMCKRARWFVSSNDSYRMAQRREKYESKFHRSTGAVPLATSPMKILG